MIRAAHPADLPAIAALHTRARATYYQGHIPEQAYLGDAELQRTREGWSRAMARDAAEGEVLCAEQDGELTGVAAFRTRDGETTLTQLHVDPVHWRRGTGAALHAACLDAWRRAGDPPGPPGGLRAQPPRPGLLRHPGLARRPVGPRSGTHRTLWLQVGEAPDPSGE